MSTQKTPVDIDVIKMALKVLQDAQKHHMSVSRPLAIENYGSVDECSKAGKQVWFSDVPDCIELLSKEIAIQEADADPSKDLFYLVDYGKHAGSFVSFWRNSGQGYTPYLENAAVYSRAEIEANRDFLDNEETVPVSIHSIGPSLSQVVDISHPQNHMWRSSEGLRKAIQEPGGEVPAGSMSERQ